MRVSRDGIPTIPSPVGYGGEAEIRLALAELRRRGLRRFDKYPPEDWEESLTAEELEKLKA